MLRRLRGILRTALLWSVAWTVPGIVWMSGVTWLINHRGGVAPDAFNFVWSVVLNWSLVGALSGGVFAAILSMAERTRGTVAALGMSRVAAWGTVGGVALPWIVLPFYSSALPNPIQQAVIVSVLNGLLGAGAATGSLALARRADALAPGAAHTTIATTVT